MLRFVSCRLIRLRRIKARVLTSVGVHEFVIDVAYKSNVHLYITIVLTSINRS